MKARLYQKYMNEVRPALQQKRGYKNVHQIPRMEKIVVNMGVSASLEKVADFDARAAKRGVAVGAETATEGEAKES